MLEAAVLKINSSKVLHGITTGLQLHSFSLLDYLYNAGRKHVWKKYVNKTRFFVPFII